MPPHRSWMDEPQYQHVESNPNPAFRPSIDKLISKLRGLSSLKEHPDAVLFVVNDLVDWFFVREKQRPTHLWVLAERTMHRFFMTIQEAGVVPMVPGVAGPNAKERLEVEFILRGPHEDVGTIELPFDQPGPVYVGDSPPGEIENRNSKSAPVLVLGEDEKKRGEASGIFLTPDDSQAVQKIIFDHTWNNNNNTCACGRPYNFTEQWARHVRIRIWRYLKNEFKPD